MRQSFAQVLRRSWAPKRSTPICFAEIGNDGPDGPVAQFGPHYLPALAYGAKEPSVFKLGCSHRRVDTLLDPERNGDGADAATLATHVRNHPTSLTHLDVLDVEVRQLPPAQGAADQQRQYHVVALALQRRAVGHGEQFLGLLARQPVSQAGSLLPDVRDFGQISGFFGGDDAVAPRFPDQPPHRGQADH